jgi:hypothetical protein
MSSDIKNVRRARRLTATIQSDIQHFGLGDSTEDIESLVCDEPAGEDEGWIGQRVRSSIDIYSEKSLFRG